CRSTMASQAWASPFRARATRVASSSSVLAGTGNPGGGLSSTVVESIVFCDSFVPWLPSPGWSGTTAPTMIGLPAVLRLTLTAESSCDGGTQENDQRDRWFSGCPYGTMGQTHQGGYAAFSWYEGVGEAHSFVQEVRCPHVASCTSTPRPRRCAHTSSGRSRALSAYPSNSSGSPNPRRPVITVPNSTGREGREPRARRPRRYSWQRLRFEVTEEGSPGCDAVRYSYTPTLGMFTAITKIGRASCRERE